MSAIDAASMREGMFMAMRKALSVSGWADPEALVAVAVNYILWRSIDLGNYSVSEYSALGAGVAEWPAALIYVEWIEECRVLRRGSS